MSVASGNSELCESFFKPLRILEILTQLVVWFDEK